MHLATYAGAGGPRLGVVSGKWMVSLRRAWQASGGKDGLPEEMSSFLAAGSDALAQAKQALDWVRNSGQSVDALEAAGVLVPLDDIRWLPPVLRPGKLICAAHNYPAGGDTDWQPPDYPVLFLKLASTLTGHGTAIVLPRVSQQVVFEAELAVVIGRAGKHIPLEKALEHVGGYTLANDVTARDLEQRASQWATGKLPETFTPLGPVLVTPDQAPDLATAQVRAWRNGWRLQDGRLGDMVFGVADLIHYLSAITCLEPGDVILTGSPKTLDGHPAPPMELHAGDQTVVEIDGLGRLENFVRAEE